MELKDLNNETIYTIRVGRAGETDVTWAPWGKSKLYVGRRESDLPKRLASRAKGYGKKGDIIELTPVGEDMSHSGWATYTQRDYMGNGVFLIEDWYMEIQGLT
jgi:hypothetical protein